MLAHNQHHTLGRPLSKSMLAAPIGGKRAFTAVAKHRFIAWESIHSVAHGTFNRSERQQIAHIGNLQKNAKRSRYVKIAAFA